MRLAIVKTFIWATAFALPHIVSAVPCQNGKCATSLVRRAAKPIDIPVPKPIVPKPDVPVAPAPVAPKPLPKPEPKPVPVPAPRPVPDPVCKRAGGCAPTLANVDQEALRTKGQNSQKSLDDTIAASPPPADKQVDPVSQHYDTQKEPGEEPFTDEPEYLKAIPNWPQYSSDGWTQNTVRVKGAKGPQAGLLADPVLDTYSNPDMRTMVIADSKNKKLDPTPALRWSDMVMDQWKSMAGADGAKNLQFMIRDNIDTDRSTSPLDTMSAIDAAVTRAAADGADPTIMQTFRRNSEGDELANYQLIAGTPHGDRVLKMLQDFHGQMGNLNIDAFHVFRPGMKSGPNDGKEYAIVIEFGH